MSKLMAANFARLKKDKVFLISILVMFLWGSLMIISNYFQMKKYGYQDIPDSYFFVYTLLIGIMAAVFCSLYIGTEYSDGTIRNKIVVGHTRNNIYLSNFITSFAANLCMSIAFMLPVGTLGVLLMGAFETKVKVIVLYVLGSIFMIGALSAILSLVCMLIQSKAIAAVSVILGIFALLFMATYIANRLNAPENYEGYMFMDDDGVVQEGESMSNPNYITGTKRAVYERLLDIIPTGQALQYTSLTAVNLWQMNLYSILIMVIMNGAGLYFFQRKDLK